MEVFGIEERKKCFWSFFCAGGFSNWTSLLFAGITVAELQLKKVARQPVFQDRPCRTQKNLHKMKKYNIWRDQAGKNVRIKREHCTYTYMGTFWGHLLEFEGWGFWSHHCVRPWMNGCHQRRRKRLLDMDGTFMWGSHQCAGVRESLLRQCVINREALLSG